MAYVIIEKHIKKARKTHKCNACLFLIDHVENNRHDLQMKFSEIKAYLKAKDNGFKIQIGEPYLTQFVKDGSEVYFNKLIPEIHKICCDLGLYYE